MKKALERLWEARFLVAVLAGVIFVLFVLPAVMVHVEPEETFVTFSEVPEDATITETVTVTVTDKAVTANGYTRHRIYYVGEDGSSGEYHAKAEEYAKISVGDELQRTTYVQVVSYWGTVGFIAACLAGILLVLLLIVAVLALGG